VDLSVVLGIIIVGAAAYGFLNGYKDAAGITATVISSRAMRPRNALALVALAELCGPFLFGIAVASTLGKGLIVSTVVTPRFILASLAAALVWNVAMTLLGLPASSTHALVGALIGVAFASAGPQAVLWDGVLRLFAVLLLSPVLGFALSYLLLKGVFFFSRNASPRVNTTYKRLQVLTMALLGLSHGSNDAQKSIGLIAMGLVATGQTAVFAVPLWVVFVGGGSLALGAFLGGERVIRTVGGKIFRIRPVHGFTAQLASTGIVLAANISGQPISTTQIVSGAIVGAGSSESLARVRWLTVGNIALAWLVTLPSAALLAALAWTLLPDVPALR